MKIIRNFVAPKESSPFNPSRTIVLDAEEQGEIVLNGLGGDAFGIKKILPFAPQMNKIMVSARLNEDLYLFRNVLLSAVHTLFSSIEGLYAPFVIQKNNHIVFELENMAEIEQSVNIQLVGHDQYGLDKLSQAYQQIGSSMPVPRFLYGHATILAGAVNTDLGVKSKSMSVEIRRMIMSTDQSEGTIMSSIRVYNNTVRKDVFIPQLNGEFDGHYANVPFIVGSNMPFIVYASNQGIADAEVSFISESYEAQENDE